MDQQAKKAKIAAYRERKITGGVFIIKNTANGKILLLSTQDLHGSKNRYDFSQQFGGCMHFKLQKDWEQFGASAFIFEVLEELSKTDTQTPKEFAEDIEILKEIWAEKYDLAILY